MSSRIVSSVRMSNTGYHQNGKPNWWAYIGKGDNVQWVEIPKVRGDQYLHYEVDLQPGTTVYIGAGKGNYKTVRETIKTEAIAEVVA